ncbi:HNH endonuclease family protein (plasmid) [Vibrio scophthalmi]|uniref:HNH endonuclease family protein n=1 Tax=Vibrio scophthalmi TaxID=45658 RepID=UPI003EBB2663
MKSYRKIKGYLTSLLLCAVTISPALADVVKLSRSGICHTTESPNYERTKHFQPFDSVEFCLEHGRLPRSSFTDNDLQNNQKIPKYNRSDYRHWIDSNGNGLNTRHELLQSMSVNTVTYNKKKSRVLRGKWHDSYSGKIFFDSSDLEIDHIVPLKFAHDRGAWRWNPAEKERFANDMENLLPVDGILNQIKSASGPTDWLPPNQAYRCQYVIRFHRVMKKYNLIYMANEQRVINKMLVQCRS